MFGLPETFSSLKPAPSCGLEPKPVGQILVPVSLVGHGVPGPPFTTVRASPDSMVMVPLRRQPAAGNFAHNGQVLPYSGDHIPLKTKRWRCDCVFSPRL